MKDCDLCDKPAYACSGCLPGTEPPKPTNADRIRAMSDEEHAHFLVHVVSDGCPPDMDWDCQKDKDGWDACDKCWKRWLRQPAGGGTN